MATRPTKKQLDRWTKIRGLGCIVGNCPNPSGNERICDMARREEAEYEQRYGVSHRQMMTINYNDYLRTKDYGYCKSC